MGFVRVLCRYYPHETRDFAAIWHIVMLSSEGRVGTRSGSARGPLGRGRSRGVQSDPNKDVRATGRGGRELLPCHPPGTGGFVCQGMGTGESWDEKAEQSANSGLFAVFVRYRIGISQGFSNRGRVEGRGAEFEWADVSCRGESVLDPFDRVRRRRHKGGSLRRADEEEGHRL